MTRQNGCVKYTFPTPNHEEKRVGLDRCSAISGTSSCAIEASGIPERQPRLPPQWRGLSVKPGEPSFTVDCPEPDSPCHLGSLIKTTIVLLPTKNKNEDSSRKFLLDHVLQVRLLTFLIHIVGTFQRSHV